MKKMIIVSGASKGLGNHICNRLRNLGHEVIGLSRDISNLDFECYKCDISSYDEFYKQSVGGISKILDKVYSKKINKIIYTSSASIYGSINEKQNKNDNNRSLYSSTKLLNEVLLNNFCKKKIFN